jgi:hypothetical protein
LGGTFGIGITRSALNVAVIETITWVVRGTVKISTNARNVEKNLLKDTLFMIKYYWFENSQLLPYCETGKCQVASAACHDCPMCLGINKVERQVQCGADGTGYHETPFEKLTVGQEFSLHQTLLEPIYTVLEKQGVETLLVQSHVTGISQMRYSGNVFVIRK